MNQFDKVLLLVQQAQQELNEEFARHQNGVATVGTLFQLQQVQDTLGCIEQFVRNNKLPPTSERSTGMGRMIVDSWPDNSELGNILLIVEQAYRKL